MRISFLKVGLIITAWSLAGALSYANSSVACKSGQASFSSFFPSNNSNRVDCTCTQEDFKKLGIPEKITANFQDSTGKALKIEITSILPDSSYPLCGYSAAASTATNANKTYPIPNVVSSRENPEQLSAGRYFKAAKVRVLDGQNKVVREDTFDSVLYYQNPNGSAPTISFIQDLGYKNSNYRKVPNTMDPFYEMTFIVYGTDHKSFVFQGWPQYESKDGKILKKEFKAEFIDRK